VSVSVVLSNDEEVLSNDAEVLSNDAEVLSNEKEDEQPRSFCTRGVCNVFS
jgi:hypothetical protein